MFYVLDQTDNQEGLFEILISLTAKFLTNHFVMNIFQGVFFPGVLK